MSVFTIADILQLTENDFLDNEFSDVSNKKLYCGLLNGGITSELEPCGAAAVLIFRSTPLSRPNKVGLKCPSACPYVHPSVHKKFLRFQLKWYVGRGR